MATTMQNTREKIMDEYSRGLLTKDEANVEMVRRERYRLVVNTLPRDLRKTLNSAVKAGKLGHLKREGHKPEAYFHPTFDHLAREARNKKEEAVLIAAKKMNGWPVA